MKKYYLIFVAILVLGNSCKKDFLSVNETNPNNAASVSLKLILPAALSATANVMNSPRNFDFVYLWYGQWSISGGYSMPATLTQYNLLNTSYEGNFGSFYTIGKNFDDIEKGSTTPQQQIYFGIAKVMKAYIFQNLVDLYGDVPYTDAFQTGVLKPKYDKQQTIYEDLIKQIDAGITAFKTAPADAIIPDAKSDIMYAGQKSLWIRFANTLKLRILIHQAYITGRDAYIKPIASSITGGYIVADSSAMVNPGYSLSAGKMNPLWATFYNADGSQTADALQYYKAGKAAVDFYNNRNGDDWRVLAVYTGTPGFNFATLPNPVAGTTASLGTGLLQSYNQSSIILSDFESYFLQAEAAQRGWIGAVTDAKTYYDAALKANYKFFGLMSNTNIKKYGIPGTTDYNDFITSCAGDPDIDYTAATDKLKCILTQKWASLNGNTPVEIWTDYRRSGFPTFLVWSNTPNRLGPGTPPIRLLYSQREITTNSENVPAVGSKSPDAFTAKIFWQTR